MATRRSRSQTAQVVQLPSWRIMWELSRSTQKLIRNLDLLDELRPKLISTNLAIYYYHLRNFKEAIRIAKKRLTTGDFNSMEEAQALVKQIIENQKKIDDILENPPEELKKLLEKKEVLKNSMKQAKENVKSARERIKEILSIPEVIQFMTSEPPE